MGQRVPVVLPVTGPIDTRHPSTNRAPGVLLKAVDLDYDAIGPRRGAQLQTGVGSYPSSVVPPGADPDFSFDGTDTYVKGTLATEQTDLSNRWTLDVAFHAYAARTTANAVQIFQWKIDASIVAIELGIYGSSHATPNRVYAIVKTTSSAGVVGGTYTLVGGTVLFGGESTYISSGKIVRCFVRLIRDGATLTLRDSTTATATDATLVATHTHAGSRTWPTGGTWYFGRDTGLSASTTFNGKILKAVLRDVAAPATLYPPTSEFVFPRSDSVRFFASTKLLTNVHVADQSRFGSHGLVATPGAVTAGARRYYGIASTVQGMGSFSDINGVGIGAVMVGGQYAYQRTR